MSPRPPGFLTMLRTLLRDSAREGAAALRGDPEMPAEEIVRRHAICRSNACGQYLDLHDQCAECGCRVAVKVAWRTAACPLGHWQALTPIVVPPQDPPAT
ncbi:MAG TPA: hypothetical protein VIM61_05770 [Chthoniobacterales bacterium]|jgi:hypothetical protein